MRITHNLVQGTPEWHAFRADRFNASEAPAMMGASPYKSRDQLLEEKTTGIVKEVDGRTQKLFDDGHKNEELARPLAEEIIGESIFPSIISDGEIHNLPLGASLDGETVAGITLWEHKTLSQRISDSLEAYDSIPLDICIQMEQQLLLSGAEKCLFMASKGGDKKTMIHRWYYPDFDLRARVINGWVQFEKDLETHEHVAEVISPVTKPTTDLPAVVVDVSGSIVISDNFEIFELALRDFIDNRLILSPQTDQDFADLDSQIKSLKKAETALDTAESDMFSRIPTVDAMKRTKDMLHKMARDNRLAAEKLSKAKKIARRIEILDQGKQALAEFIVSLKENMGGDYLPEITADFAGAMKGKGKISSLISAANDELARTKIQINEVAEKIRGNLKTFQNAGGPDYPFLFADMKAVVQKENNDFLLFVQSRISDHKAAEERKLEAERERIRAEEKAKAEREAQEKADQAERERQEEVRIKANDEAEKAEEDRKLRAVEDAQKHTEVVRGTHANVVASQQKAAAEVFSEKPPATEGQIMQSLIENGIGKTTAKKVAALLVAGKIEGVILE